MIVLSGISLEIRPKEYLSKTLYLSLCGEKGKNQCDDEKRKGIVTGKGNWKIHSANLFSSL